MTKLIDLLEDSLRIARAEFDLMTAENDSKLMGMIAQDIRNAGQTLGREYEREEDIEIVFSASYAFLKSGERFGRELYRFLSVFVPDHRTFKERRRVSELFLERFEDSVDVDTQTVVNFAETFLDACANRRGIRLALGGGDEPGPMPEQFQEGAGGNASPENWKIYGKDMALSGGYRLESNSAAETGQMISLFGGPDHNEQGEAAFNFEGASSTYSLTLSYFDESDGEATIEILQNEAIVHTLLLDKNLNDSLASAITKTSFTLEGVEVANGDSFILRSYESGTAEGAEHARVDYVEFTPQSL